MSINFGETDHTIDHTSQFVQTGQRKRLVGASGRARKTNGQRFDLN